MPHWINLSFYSTNKKVAYSNFIPRIKLPPTRQNGYQKAREVNAKPKLIPEDECIHNNFFDYDAFDAQVFQLPPIHGTRYDIYCIYNKNHKYPTLNSFSEIYCKPF